MKGQRENKYLLILQSMLVGHQPWEDLPVVLSESCKVKDQPPWQELRRQHGQFLLPILWHPALLQRGLFGNNKDLQFCPTVHHFKIHLVYLFWCFMNTFLPSENHMD